MRISAAATAGQRHRAAHEMRRYRFRFLRRADIECLSYTDCAPLVRSELRRDCQFHTHNPSPSQHIRLDTCVLAILAVVQKHSYLSRALPELAQEVVAREISEA